MNKQRNQKWALHPKMGITLRLGQKPTYCS